MRNVLDGRIEHFNATTDVARLLAGSPLAIWTLRGVPTGPMRNVLDGRIEHFNATTDVARLLAGSPLAIWINEEAGRDG
ncbi:hypothetical protein C7E25_16340 [Stenotrophomonas maltophilia]|nr:hypothetical protein C7E25_16340 [Stenotrophomonas maltophilia]